jgi:hypothetical protein
MQRITSTTRQLYNHTVVKATRRTSENHHHHHNADPISQSSFFVGKKIL